MSEIDWDAVYVRADAVAAGVCHRRIALKFGDKELAASHESKILETAARLADALGCHLTFKEPQIKEVEKRDG